MENSGKSHQVVKKQQTNGLKKIAQAWSEVDRLNIATVIGRTFDLQKQYGKTQEQLKNVIDGFCWALAAYPVEDVIKGFGQYILKKSDMPTPSDIVAIIDPRPPEWKPDKSYYNTLKDIHKVHGPYGLGEDEIEYIKRYEECMQREMRESN